MATTHEMAHLKLPFIDSSVSSLTANTYSASELELGDYNVHIFIEETANIITESGSLDAVVKV